MKPATVRLVLFGLLGLFGAALSAALTGSIVLTRPAPALALALWPGNGEARTRQADAEIRVVLAAQMRGQPAPAGLGKAAVAAAHRGLRDQALNPVAVRIIALGGEYGDRRRYEILETGSRLSRRDTLTQLWLVQKSAVAGNLGELMSHYDALLRRQSAARDAAGQLLARAMADPKVADATVGLLKRKPDWRGLLYYYLQRQPGSWAAFVDLHRRLAGTGLIPVETSVEFAGRLVDAGRFQDAVSVARLAGTKPLDPSAGVVDRGFATQPAFPGAWAVSDPATASLQPLSDGGALLSAGRGASGLVARRLIALRPAHYRAAVDYRLSDGDGSPRLEARIACAGEASNETGGTDLVVTADCPYQWLSLYLPDPLTGEQDLYLQTVRVVPHG